MPAARANFFNPMGKWKELSFRPKWAGIFLRAVFARRPTKRRNHGVIRLSP